MTNLLTRPATTTHTLWCSSCANDMSELNDLYTCLHIFHFLRYWITFSTTVRIVLNSELNCFCWSVRVTFSMLSGKGKAVCLKIFCIPRNPKSTDTHSLRVSDV